MDWQSICFIIATTVVLLAIARYANQFLMQRVMSDELTKSDNAALGVAMAGYLFGVMLIIADVLSGEGHGDWLKDTLSVAGYGIFGIVFLLFVGAFEMRLILSSRTLEQVRSGNLAAGIALTGSFISTSQIIAATVCGEGSGGNVMTAIVFFVIGQISLLLITYVYRFLTDYDDAAEIMNGNNAAALSYAGMMIAVAIVVAQAIRGDFTDYVSSLMDYSAALIVVLAFYPVRQIFIQGILLGGGFKFYGGRLDEEIGKDKNIGAGFIEAATYISTALLAVRLF